MTDATEHGSAEAVDQLWAWLNELPDDATSPVDEAPTPPVDPPDGYFEAYEDDEAPPE